MSGICDKFSGSLTADVLKFNPDAILEPDTLVIHMTRGERRIADELRKQFGSFKRVVINVDGEQHEFGADSLIQMLEDYEDSNDANATQDSREKLEADALALVDNLRMYGGKYAGDAEVEIIGMLERQAAITKRECCKYIDGAGCNGPEVVHGLNGRIAELAKLGGSTLTAEQVREAIKANSWAETSSLFEFNDSSWQAIADEMNAELGSGTCEMETSWEIRDELGIADAPEDTSGYRCSACGDSFRYDRGIKPNFCPECGRKVVSA